MHQVMDTVDTVSYSFDFILDDLTIPQFLKNYFLLG